MKKRIIFVGLKVVEAAIIAGICYLIALLGKTFNDWSHNVMNWIPYNYQLDTISGFAWAFVDGICVILMTLLIFVLICLLIFGIYHLIKLNWKWASKFVIIFAILLMAGQTGASWTVSGTCKEYECQICGKALVEWIKDEFPRDHMNYSISYCQGSQMYKIKESFIIVVCDDCHAKYSQEFHGYMQGEYMWILDRYRESNKELRKINEEKNRQKKERQLEQKIWKMEQEIKKLKGEPYEKEPDFYIDGTPFYWDSGITIWMEGEGGITGWEKPKDSDTTPHPFNRPHHWPPPLHMAPGEMR